MGKVLTYLSRMARRARGDSGATAVEFVIVLPVMLLTFAVIVEGARIYWNYQATVAGVRDASRYLARTTNNDICGGTANLTRRAITGGAGVAAAIVNRNMGTGSANLFPTAVSLTGTSADYICVSVTGVGVVPVAVVDASVSITLPLSPLWGFFQGTPNGTMTSTITDQSRIYGI